MSRRSVLYNTGGQNASVHFPPMIGHWWYMLSYCIVYDMLVYLQLKYYNVISQCIHWCSVMAAIKRKHGQIRQTEQTYGTAPTHKCNNNLKGFDLRLKQAATTTLTRLKFSSSRNWSSVKCFKRLFDLRGGK